MSYRIRYERPRRRRGFRELLSQQCMIAALLLVAVLFCAMAGGTARGAAEALFVRSSGALPTGEEGYEALVAACRAYIFGQP